MIVFRVWERDFKMAARGRKQKASLLKWNLGETLETHHAGKATEKRQNFDPSTPPACAEHLHFMLNGEIRRAPGLPPDACAQTAWEDADKRKQLNYTCMLQNLLKLYCIWTWDTLLLLLFLLCAVLFYFVFPLWWDNYRTTTEAPSPGLEAEGTPKLLRLKLYCIWTWRFFLLLLYRVWEEVEPDRLCLCSIFEEFILFFL
jgi:hypothetical protein